MNGLKNILVLNMLKKIFEQGSFNADDIPAQEKYVDKILIKWYKIKDIENEVKNF